MLSKFLQFLPYIEAVVPRWILHWVAERLPHEGFQRVREVTRTIHERSVEIFNEKKAALQQGDEALKCQIAEGKDIMSLLRKPHPARALQQYSDRSLVKADMTADVHDRLTEEELVAQMS